MKIVIFGGTSEGRELSHELAKAGAQVVVSVASDYGVEEQGAFDGVKVECGPKEKEEICEMIRGADAVVDATHPYAVIVTDNIRRAAEETGVERFRLLRKSDDRCSADDGDIVCLKDAYEAARYAKAGGGRVLLTTGSKDLGVYAESIDPELLYPRVLPLISSIEACEKAGIPHRNIIAVQGPFSEELNRAVIKDYGIDMMITKDSGAAGGFLEKINAARSCGVPVIVIARPEEEGLGFDDILAVFREKMK